VTPCLFIQVFHTNTRHELGPLFVATSCMSTRVRGSPRRLFIHVFLYQPGRHPFTAAHCITFLCPPSAARAHTKSSHGQPFTRAHSSTSM